MKYFYSFILSTIIGFQTNAQTDTIYIDFESTTPLIKIDNSNTDNIWTIGEPSKPKLNHAFSGNNVIMTDTSDFYADGNKSSFDVIIVTNINPELDLINITFRMLIETDTLKDGLFLEYSLDKGQSFQLVGECGTVNYNDSIITDIRWSSLHDSTVGLTGSPYFGFDWMEASILFSDNLNCNFIFPPIFDQLDTLLLRFTFISDSLSTLHEGILIDDIKAEFSFHSGINSDSKTSNLPRIYPNPSKSLAYLELPNPNTYLIEVYDLNGRNIYKNENYTNLFIIPTKNFESGIYLVRLTGMDELISLKLFIQK